MRQLKRIIIDLAAASTSQETDKLWNELYSDLLANVRKVTYKVNVVVDYQDKDNKWCHEEIIVSNVFVTNIALMLENQIETHVILSMKAEGKSVVRFTSALEFKASPL